MNIWFLLAGGLSLLAAPVHLMGGEYVFKRMSDAVFPEIPNGNGSIAKQELRFGWHMVSISLFFSGMMLLWFALDESLEGIRLTATFIAVYFLGYAVVIAIIPALSLKTGRTLLQSPQWLLCLGIALLILRGIA